MAQRKIFVISITVPIVLLLLFFPFTTEVAPEWKVLFVNETGDPVAGVRAEQVCNHYTYSEENICGTHSDSIQVSDSNGIVSFPRRTISLPLPYRLARGAFAYLTLLAHGSVGRDFYLLVIPPDGYQFSAGLLKYESFTEAQEVTLEQEREQEN